MRNSDGYGEGEGDGGSQAATPPIRFARVAAPGIPPGEWAGGSVALVFVVVAWVEFERRCWVWHWVELLVGRRSVAVDEH